MAIVGVVSAQKPLNKAGLAAYFSRTHLQTGKSAQCNIRHVLLILLPMPTLLTAQQQAQYQQNGYLVLPDFKTAADIAALRARAEEIVNAFDPSGNISVFTTREQSRSVDDYFMDSANKVSCFFEEEAFDATGQLKQDKALSINKIGHAMHDLDPVFDQFSRGPALASLAAGLGLEQPKIWQSMYIFKQPGIGGEVRWHQDATFFDTTPLSVTTFWFALEDASVRNGCLWVEPGGHRGPLRERFVKQDGIGTTGAGPAAAIETLDNSPWPDDHTAVPVEVSAGTLVVFHGLLPHYSAPNRSPVSRHAYTLHATDGRSVYSPQNWLQRGADLPVRGF
jgi:phytanoyl-CoA hydroxylase